MERYRLGPFLIASELVFPELTAADSGEPDVWIRLGAAPERIQDVVANESRWWASNAEYLQRVPGVATFYVSHGREIVVEPAAGSLPGDIRAYLLAPIFTSLCFQNGMYALHASSVEVSGGVVAFLGHSGAGKSTLVAHLEKRGFPVVSDDFCLLAPFAAENGAPVVIPVAPAVKLWPSALSALGTSPDGLPRVWSQEEKFRLKLRESNERLPLRELYLLEWGEQGSAPEFEPLAGPEAVARLIGLTHFEYLLKPTGRLQESFLLSARILSAVPAFTLRRAKDFNRIGEVVDRLEKRMLAEGRKAAGPAASVNGL